MGWPPYEEQVPNNDSLEYAAPRQFVQRLLWPRSKLAAALDFGREVHGGSFPFLDTLGAPVRIPSGYI